MTPLAALCVCADVRKQKQEEAELRAKQERFLALRERKIAEQRARKARSPPCAHRSAAGLMCRCRLRPRRCRSRKSETNCRSRCVHWFRLAWPDARATGNGARAGPRALSIRLFRVADHLPSGGRAAAAPRNRARCQKGRLGRGADLAASGRQRRERRRRRQGQEEDASGGEEARGPARAGPPQQHLRRAPGCGRRARCRQAHRDRGPRPRWLTLRSGRRPFRGACSCGEGRSGGGGANRSSYSSSGGSGGGTLSRAAALVVPGAIGDERSVSGIQALRPPPWRGRAMRARAPARCQRAYSLPPAASATDAGQLFGRTASATSAASAAAAHPAHPFNKLVVVTGAEPSPAPAGALAAAGNAASTAQDAKSRLELVAARRSRASTLPGALERPLSPPSQQPFSPTTAAKHRGRRGRILTVATSGPPAAAAAATATPDEVASAQSSSPATTPSPEDRRHRKVMSAMVESGVAAKLSSEADDAAAGQPQPMTDGGSPPRPTRSASVWAEVLARSKKKRGKVRSRRSLALPPCFARLALRSWLRALRVCVPMCSLCWCGCCRQRISIKAVIEARKADAEKAGNTPSA
jgi:hypothetical protein